MKNKKIKRKYYILITILLIFFSTFTLLKLYTKKTSKKINKIAMEYFQSLIDNNINATINKVTKQNLINDILEIFKNQDGEILYVNYNLEKSYEVLDIITQNIKKEIDKNSYPSDGIVLNLPFMINSDNLFFTNLGPKITIKINYVDSIIANIYTKITNYGLNNALVEAYIKISINGKIITPMSDKKVGTTYDFLLSSKVINGKVPEFYGSNLISSSVILDVPISI